MTIQLSEFRLITDEDLREIASECISVNEIVKKIGLNVRWGAEVRLRLESLGCCPTPYSQPKRPGNWEFTEGRRRSVRKAAKVRREQLRLIFETETLPLLFVKDSTINPKRARALIRHWNPEYKWLEYKCQKCGNTGEWLGQTLVLQIDHINGDSWDHRLINLRFICPNCHAQTETFTGKAIAIKKRIAQG